MSSLSHETNQKIAAARADFLQRLVRVFDSPDGSFILDWLHSTAATRKPAFVPGDRDPYAAASRDGRKSIVWEIEANLKEARESYGATPQPATPATTGGRRSRRKDG